MSLVVVSSASAFAFSFNAFKFPKTCGGGGGVEWGAGVGGGRDIAFYDFMKRGCARGGEALFRA